MKLLNSYLLLSCFSDPQNWLSWQHLCISRLLAPVRVRQDSNSFTVMLEIRHALPTTLQLAWSACENALQLMPTCSSCASGKCSMQWGIVLHCPAPTPSFSEERQQQPSGNNVCPENRPRVISCDVSFYNVVLVIEKPPSLCSWWNSIAVGRALGPGLQVASFS